MHYGDRLFVQFSSFLSVKGTVQGQRDCDGGRGRLFPHQQPHHLHHERGECPAEHAAAGGDHAPECAGHQIHGGDADGPGYYQLTDAVHPG